ncbi:hypothetical protein GV64_04130 [Endozoicomonas elysicola]|uniref:Uncharacterized protein n=1 Tax=Endozoicomonas elysicola TaxID=305900 RepID=A0A081K7B5_9GAMM|nr:hypothetical protein GV64_04130 [Endozoicomonas elysicola]
MRYILTLITTILRISFSTLLNQVANSLVKNHGRTITRKESIKRSWVRTIWLIAGIIMLFNPALPIIMIIALPTTFLSFMILDEMQ